MPRENHVHLTLQQTEGALVRAATQIYAAYITAGVMADGDGDAWMKRSIDEAIAIAKAVEAAVVAEREVG